MPDSWRNRCLTIVSIAGFLFATGWLFPDPRARAEKQYLFVISLGYGHLIGAVVFSAARLARFVPAGVPPRLFGAFMLTSALTLFSGYAWIAALYPAFFVPLLAISLWHIVENDVAIAQSYRAGPSLAPLARGLRANAGIVAATATLLFTGDTLLRPVDYGGTLDGTIFAPLRGVLAGLLGRDFTGFAWLGFGDFFSAVTLYHLIGFLVFFSDRARAQRAKGLPTAALWRRLFWIHVPPLAVCGTLLAIRDPHADLLRTLLFSPGIYLFWSVLHVIQTAWVRGVAGPGRPFSVSPLRA